VFLQKILQSMEDPEAPMRAALIYTTLSVLIRLIGSQAAVFSLWYGRRAYERSRGEMITMLYEKTLSRKVVSVSSKVQPDQIESNGNGVTKEVDRSRLQKALDYLLSPFGFQTPTPKDKKRLATMGKIMNLMR
jgi:hypothetical protein